MIDNKTQVLLPRILLPLVSSTTFHFDSPSSFSSSISSFSSLPLVPLLLLRRFSASPLLFRSGRFRLIALWHSFTGAVISLSFPLHLRAPSLPFLLLTHSHFHYYPHPLRSSSRSRQLFFLSSPLHSARCLLRCTPLGVRTSFRLMQHYDSVMSSFIFRGRSDEDGLLTASCAQPLLTKVIKPLRLVLFIVR